MNKFGRSNSVILLAILGLFLCLFEESKASDILLGRSSSISKTSELFEEEEIDIEYTIYNQSTIPLEVISLEVPINSSYEILSTVPKSELDLSKNILSWSIDSIAPLGEFKVTVTLGVNSESISELDSGASVWAFSGNGFLEAGTSPLLLLDSSIDETFLEPTIDADSEDIFIQRKATELGYDPQLIFDYVQKEIGIEVYSGSLRGARGTMWSGSGNAIDQASLLIALLRASNIPCRYIETDLLDRTQAQEIVTSMFPELSQYIGFVDPDADLSDPLNDENLLADASIYYCVEYFDGNDFVVLNPVFINSEPGQQIVNPVNTYAELDDSLRHKVNIALEAEWLGTVLTASPDQFEYTTPLSETFATVEVYGAPLSIGFFNQPNVNPGGILSPIFAMVTNTYTPFLVRGMNDGNFLDDFLKTGTPMEEVFFQFASTILFKIDLILTYTTPAGNSKEYIRTIYDRVGLSGRVGPSAPVSIEDNAPALTPYDTATILIAPGIISPEAIAPQSERIIPISDELGALVSQVEALAENEIFTEDQQLLLARANELMSYSAILTGEATTLSHAIVSDTFLQELSDIYVSAVYYDTPRILIAETSVDDEELRVMLDLRANDVQVVPSPGQNNEVPYFLRIYRGHVENTLEGQILENVLGEPALTTGAVFNEKPDNNQILFLSPGDPSGFDQLNLSPAAKFRILNAMQEGRFIIAPSNPVFVSGFDDPISAWWEVNENGYLVGVLEDGGHLSAVEYAGLFLISLRKEIFFSIGAMHGFTGGTILFIANFLGEINNGTPAKEAVEASIETSLERVEEIEDALEGVGPGRSASKLTKAFADGYEEAAELTVNVMRYRVRIDPPVLPFLSGLPEQRRPRTVKNIKFVNANENLSDISGTFPVSGLFADGEFTESRSSDPIQRILPVNEITGSSFSLDTNSSIFPRLISQLANVSGTGSVAVYPRQDASSVRSSAVWNEISGTAQNGQITIESDRLRLDGSLQNPGEYIVPFTDLSFTGSGSGFSSNQLDDYNLEALNSLVCIGPTNGIISIGSTTLNLVNGFTVSGFDGAISTGSNQLAEMDGTAENFLFLQPSLDRNTITFNENIILSLDIRTTISGDYSCYVSVPKGFEIAVLSDDKYMITALPGAESGVKELIVNVRSADQPEFSSTAAVEFTMSAAETRSIDLRILPDPLTTVPFGVEGTLALPTAYIAEIENTGGASERIYIQDISLSDEFEILTAVPEITVQPGETGQIGFFLQPISDVLPPPGSIHNFSIRAYGSGSGSPSDQADGSFIVPVIAGAEFFITPSLVQLSSETTSQEIELIIRSLGTTKGDYNLSFETPTGIEISDFPVQPVTVAAAETLSIPVTVTYNEDFPFGGRDAVLFTLDRCVAEDDCLPSEQRFSYRSLQVSVQPESLRCMESASVLAELIEEESISGALTNALSRYEAVLGITPIDDAVCSFVSEGLQHLSSELSQYPEIQSAIQQSLGRLQQCDLEGSLMELTEAICELENLFNLELRYKFQLKLSPDPVILMKNQIIDSELEITRFETDPLTLKLELDQSTVPDGIIAEINPTTITLDESPTSKIATLRIESQINEPVSSLVRVNVTPEDAPQRTRAVEAFISIRPAFINVLRVNAELNDTEDHIEVSADLFKSANIGEQYRIRTELFSTDRMTSNPLFTNLEPLDLNRPIGNFSIELGEIPTSGLEDPFYTVRVSVERTDGNTDLSLSADTQVLTNLPIDMEIFAAPNVLPPGDSALSTIIKFKSKSIPESNDETVPLEINAVLETVLDNWDYEPMSTDIESAPMVGDINNDGISDIIIITHDRIVTGNELQGIMRVIDGNTLEPIWNSRVDEIPLRVTSPALADIDQDGYIEIVAVGLNDNLAAFEHDGNIKWISGSMTENTGRAGSPSIANLDSTGLPEIIFGASVINAEDGSIRWEGTDLGGRGFGDGPRGPLTICVDLDLDGDYELLAGRTAYHHDGSIYWELSTDDGISVIGNFDDDEYPEIIFRTFGFLYLLEHDGTIVWGPVESPNQENGPPTIGDVDNDGELDIAVASNLSFLVYNSDGSVKWSVPTDDSSSGSTSSTIYDLNGDSFQEIIYGDEINLYIFEGATGEILYSAPKSSGTLYEYPVVVDFDNDGSVEILAAANTGLSNRPNSGLYIFGSANNSWKGSRRIWNQYNYHVTNVDENGDVRINPVNQWQVDQLNNFRVNSNIERDGSIPALNVEITHTFSDSDNIQTGYLNALPSPVSYTENQLIWSFDIPKGDIEERQIEIPVQLLHMPAGQIQQLNDQTRVRVSSDLFGDVTNCSNYVRNGRFDEAEITSPTLLLENGVHPELPGWEVYGPDNGTVELYRETTLYNPVFQNYSILVLSGSPGCQSIRQDNIVLPGGGQYKLAFQYGISNRNSQESSATFAVRLLDENQNMIREEFFELSNLDGSNQQRPGNPPEVYLGEILFSIPEPKTVTLEIESQSCANMEEGLLISNVEIKNTDCSEPMSIETTLPPLFASTTKVLSLSPASKRVSGNVVADYEVTITNPVAQELRYDLEFVSNEQIENNLPEIVIVPAEDFVSFGLELAVQPAIPEDISIPFVITTSTESGIMDSVDGSLTVTETKDSLSFAGVNLELSPSPFEIGRGMSRDMTATITNTGSDTDDFLLLASSSVNTVIADPEIKLLTPGLGASETRTIRLTHLLHMGKPEEGETQFTILANAVSSTESGASDFATADIIILDQGVKVFFDLDCIHNGEPVTFCVRNTGIIPDVYDLELGGVASAGLELPLSFVELEAGEEECYTLIVDNLDYLLQQDQGLFLEGKATSQTNDIISAIARTEVLTDSTDDFEISVTPDQVDSLTPQRSSLQLLIRNTADNESVFRIETLNFEGETEGFLINSSGTEVRVIDQIRIVSRGQAIIPVIGEIREKGSGSFEIKVTNTTSSIEKSVIVQFKAGKIDSVFIIY